MSRFSIAGRGPDIASLSRTSNPQLTSLFFTRLPIEIRNLIYLEFWNLSSPRLHIHAKEVQLPRSVVPGVDSKPPSLPSLRWSHTRCIDDPRAPDVRLDAYSRAAPGSAEKALWAARVKSEWCLHWPCQEAKDRERGDDSAGDGKSIRPQCLQSGVAGPRRSVFLDVLRTCKRMYLECLPSIYSNTTFVFTNKREAVAFLLAYGQDDDRYPIRSLELCVRVSSFLGWIYASEPEDDERPPPLSAGPDSPGVSFKFTRGNNCATC